MPLRGFSTRELRELEQRHGSLEKAAEADPELAEYLRVRKLALDAAGARVAPFRSWSMPRNEPPRMEEPLSAEEIRRAEVEKIAEGFELARARAEAKRKKQQPSARKRPGVRPKWIPHGAAIKALGLLEANARLEAKGRAAEKLTENEIASEADLSRHYVRLVECFRRGNCRMQSHPTEPLVVIVRR